MSTNFRKSFNITGYDPEVTNEYSNTSEICLGWRHYAHGNCFSGFFSELETGIISSKYRKWDEENGVWDGSEWRYPLLESYDRSAPLVSFATGYKTNGIEYLLGAKSTYNAKDKSPKNAIFYRLTVTLPLK